MFKIDLSSLAYEMNNEHILWSWSIHWMAIVLNLMAKPLPQWNKTKRLKNEIKINVQETINLKKFKRLRNLN